MYADPPFDSNRDYAAPIGSKAAGAAFKDTWTLGDVDVAWHGEIAEREPEVYAAIDAAGIVQGSGMKSYLIMMAVRLLEIRRILRPTGSFYLHCDDTADAYLRMLCDAVFGSANLRSKITWKRHNARSLQRRWPRVAGSGEADQGNARWESASPREVRVAAAGAARSDLEAQAVLGGHARQLTLVP